MKLTYVNDDTNATELLCDRILLQTDGIEVIATTLRDLKTLKPFTTLQVRAFGVDFRAREGRVTVSDIGSLEVCGPVTVVGMRDR